MNKIFLAVLIMAAFLVAGPVLAKTASPSPWAALIKFVQDIVPGGGGGGEGEMAVPEEKQFDEDFVDPREVKQTLREIKDLKRELNRFVKQLQKTAGAGDDINQLNNLLQELSNFENQLGQSPSRDVIQEFRDANYWEQINKFRARIEIPKQIAQWKKEIKRLETILKQKKNQNLGLNLEGPRTKLSETTAGLARVEELYNAGEFEEAMEEFNGLREEFNPADVGNVIQRTQELMARLKRVRDNDVKNQIKEAYQEVIDNFNQGEYRTAWELMNESFGEIMGVVDKAYQTGKKKGYSKENLLQMSNKLEEQLKDKAEEKRARFQEIREMKEGKSEVREMKQPIEPAQPARPAMPAQPSRGGQPVQPAEPARPAQPAEPSQSIRPAEPAPMVQPTQPTEQIQPTQ